VVTCASRRDFLQASTGFALTAGSALAATLAGSRAAAQTAGAAGNRLPNSDPRGNAGDAASALAAQPDPLVTRMLQLAQVGASDALVDLGCGDGRIAIAAARDFGASVRGIDYDPNIVELARRNAEQAGVSGRVRFEQGDLLAADLSSADVVTMYLTAELTLRLRRALLALRPGTRVVSREFRMGDWQPEESSRIGLRSMHLWVVPANAGGDWKLQLQQARGPVDVTMTIRQRFQVLDGRVMLAGVETTLRDARVLGDGVHFAFTDSDGALRIVDARVELGRMIGAVSTREGDVAPLLAERTGDAPPIEGASSADDATR